MADLVDEHRTAVAARILVRPEHEVVEEQLRPPLEQVEQRRLALRTVEGVVLVDPNHRQPATLGGERVACTAGFLFLGKELVARCLPLRCGDDRGKVHNAPLTHSYSSCRRGQPSGSCPRPFGVRSSSCQVAFRTSVPRS